MSNRKNIFITGFSGAGKSTVGKHLAMMLGWSFVDTDKHIEHQENKSISSIFEGYGELEFRKIETKTINEVCQSQYQVVATGGGVVLSEVNRLLMQEHGIIVCLEATVETLCHRLNSSDSSRNGDEIRPLLKGAELTSKINKLKSARQFVYSMSNYTVHTDNLSVSEVSANVFRNWKHFEKKNELNLLDGATSFVETSQAIYPILVGWGLLDHIAKK